MDEELFDGSRVVGYHKPELKCHYVRDNESLHHFLQNDAVIAELGVFLSDFLDENQMNYLGRAVGNSLGPNEIALEPFFIWLAHNRSIEIFDVFQVTFSDQDHFAILAPFFEHNHNLRCIELYRANASKFIPTLISAISRAKMNRLARIRLSTSGIGDKKAAELINALNSMSGLSNLLDLWLGGNRIGINGCRALFSLLKNPECRIMSLDLSSNPFDDECIAILVGGFIICKTLK